MKHLIVLVLAATAITANALEHGEGLDNPIIEFFEAPVRAFKTKVAEDVQPALSTAPEGKSVGIAKSKNNSWFRGKGLADWLNSRNAATTASPQVALNSAPLANAQQYQAFNAPNRRRLVRRQNQNVRRVGNGGQNVNWRRNAKPNRRRVYRRPYSDEDDYSNEDEYDDFSGGRHYQMTYDTVPYHSASYDDEDDGSVSYIPQRKHNLRRGHGESHKKVVKPNSSYLQPFQDMPLQARPVRLRQNLPVTKPIRNKQQGNKKPAATTNQNQGNQQSNKNKKKKNKNKNKPANNIVNPQTVQQDPVHFIVHPQGNGQLPVLIPVNDNKKNKGQNVMNDPSDYQNYQYIPIPVNAYGQQGGYRGIPQIKVIAQHVHTFRPHSGFPTEVILGPGGFDNGFFEQDNVQAAPPKRRPLQNKVEANTGSTQNQKIILTATNSNETPITMVTEQMVEPTKQTIVLEELKPETTLATQTTASGDGMMEMAMSDDDKLNAAEMRSVDGRPHIVVPRHIFPIFGASSLVEVANNGRFFLKSGRDLKVDDAEEDEALIEVVDETPEESVQEVVVEEAPLKEALTKDEQQKVEQPEEPTSTAEPIKSDLGHSVTKKDEASLDEPLAAPSPTTASIPEESSKPKAVEKPSSDPIQIRPEQLQDIPVKIVHEEPVIRVEKTARSVTHEHKPKLKSEVVHEKANGHFIVKSGVAPVVESRSNVRFHGDDKLTDSEIQHIKITPIENSRAL